MTPAEPLVSMMGRKWKSLFGLAFFGLLFSSCEALIQTSGTVCDKNTNQPVSGVLVQLIWTRNNDTLKAFGLKADTLTYSDRMKLRRNGIKDSNKQYDLEINRWGRLVPLFTDSAGSFKAVTLLVGAVFGIPKTAVLFTKDGYKPLVVADKNRRDTVVYLEKSGM